MGVIADKGKRLRYVEIADDIRSRVQGGKVAPGSRVGTFGSLMQDYAAAKGTIDKALGVLRQEGIVVTMSGKGIFAAESAVPAVSGPQDIRTLSEQVAELRTEMRALRASDETLGRIEGNLVELYDKTGNEYPWEDLPDGERQAREADEGGSRHDQHA